MNDGDPAFPISLTAWQADKKDVHVPHKGMTLRDYFAAMAMQGMLAYGDEGDYYTGEDIPVNAYKKADAMLRVRRNES